MTNKVIIFLAIALPIVVPVLLYFLFYQVLSGGGQVLDLKTREPVEGALVQLSCNRSNFSHGSTTIRRVERVTDSKGRYKFGLLDVIGCNSVYLYAYKDGYIASSSIDTKYATRSYSRIQKIKYVTKDADVFAVRLEAIKPRTPPINLRNRSERNVRSIANYYSIWFDSFFEAKSRAKADDENKIVKERYCEYLIKLYNSLSQTEKAKFKNKRFWYSRAGTYDETFHDFDIHVMQYCDGYGQPTINVRETIRNARRPFSVGNRRR